MRVRVSAKWVVLWSLWAARLAREPTAPLRVRGGLVRGALARDGSHAAYLGIPYATLTRENRFQSPGPEPHWDGILDAFDANVKCPQRFGSRFMLGQEDCLVVNVYTPLEASRPLPVLVFIHGGGYRDGSGSPFFYGPQHLLKHGVILVTFNYRLEISGFLSLGTRDAPGNAGLKDQVAALRWVQNNIRAFGGDPDNVTIFGESAGAASVSFHLISPMSTGLFKRAIMQSGTSIAPWSLQFDPLEIAKSFVKQLGHDSDNPNEMYKILMTKTIKELIMTRIPRAKGNIVQSENIFVPCVEKKIEGIEQFLPDTPFNLISKGKYQKVPVLIGYNNAEGYLFAAKENDTTISSIDFYKSLPRDLAISNEEDKLNVARMLKNVYMGDREVSKETLLELSRYEGDSGITYPVLETIDLFLKTNTEPVFAYRFDYDGWLNIAKLYSGFVFSPGATHADDLFYIFKPEFATLHILDMDIVDKVTKMWTNFAKFSDPTPDASDQLPRWPPAVSSDPQLLVIDKTLRRRPLWQEDTFRVWNDTYAKFRRKI